MASKFYQVSGSLATGYKGIIKADSEEEAMKLAGSSSGAFPKGFSTLWCKEKLKGQNEWQVNSAKEVSEEEIMDGQLWAFLDEEE